MAVNLINSFSVNAMNRATVNSTANHSYEANSTTNLMNHLPMNSYEANSTTNSMNHLLMNSYEANSTTNSMNHLPMNSFEAISTTNSMNHLQMNSFEVNSMNHLQMNSLSVHPSNHSPVNNATANSAVTVKSLKSLINSSSDTELKARHSEIRSLSAQIAEQEKTLYQARHKVAPQNAQELNRIRALIIKLKYSLEEQTRQAEIEQVKLGYFDKSDPTVDNKSQKCIAYSGQDGSKVKFVGTCQFETIQF